MSTKSMLVLGAAFLSAAAFAQQTLGIVTQVNGAATFTDGANVGRVINGTAVKDGMTFVTASGGSIKLEMTGGSCSVSVPSSGTLTVSNSMTCQQLQDAVQQQTTVGQSGGAAAGGSTGLGALGVAGLIVGFKVGEKAFLDKKPNSGE